MSGEPSQTTRPRIYRARVRYPTRCLADGGNPQASEALGEVLAAARPRARVLVGTDELRKRAIIASVLGPEAGLPRVGRFVVERRVARWGAQVVFLGRHPDDGRPVAVKVFGAVTSTDRSGATRDAAALREVATSCVVDCLDHGVTDDGLDYLVTEWVEGEALDLLARSPRQPGRSSS